MHEKQLLQKIEKAAREKVEMLDLSGMKIAKLPTKIRTLTNLTGLYLYDNQLTALPAEIGSLTNLTELSLSNNQLTALPAVIGSLTKLIRLSLSDNQLTGLPTEIGTLTKLTQLYLNNNQLTGLPTEIGTLTNLTRLDLDHNQLTAIPPKIAQLKNLTQLDLSANPNLTSPPPAIVKQGTEAVLAYLREQLEGESEQWVSKMLLIGEGGVGKTSTLCSLLGIPFDERKMTTRGVDIENLDLPLPEKPDITMRLNCWDFGGQTIYHATHQFFLTDRSLFILVWDTRHGWEAGKLYKWLDTIQGRAPKSPILLVAAHVDERDAVLPLAELQRKYPQIVGHYAISNKEQTGVEELRAAITKATAGLPLMGEKWPAAWLNAAEAIRNRHERHITANQLFDAMAKHDIAEDNVHILAQWMHDLGDILYFNDDEELRDTVILNPEWVSKYIGRVLESPEVAEGVGIFTRELMEKLWDDIVPVMQDRFLRLMERFDLSYRTLENRDISLVVERLSLDPADYEERWAAIKNNPDCNEISMKFTLNTIPAGIPTWFIARTHRFTTRTHWRLGALFADGKERRHLALVYVDEHSRCIHLTVRGPAPHNFFTLLKDGLELTLDRFPGLKITRTMPCPGHNDKRCVHEFDYAYLQNAIEQKPPVAEIQCLASLQMVSVSGLVFGIHWLTQDLVLAAIEKLRLESAADNELILAEIQDLRAMAQRQFSRLFRIEQEKIEAYCPNVFIVKPVERKAWQKWLMDTGSLRHQPPPSKIKIHLCCEHPGGWHPTIDGGVYDINQPAEWLTVMAPFLQKLVAVLKYTLPMVEPTVGIIGSTMAKEFESSLKFTMELVDRLPELVEIRKPDFADFAGKGERLSHVEGEALRALDNFLKENKQPQQPHWGGLKKVVTPEGHFLWLCAFHAKEYAP